tara:strand:- start:20 stop:331 length:312 start_codon:yes stop_codon:yes gene_type:complete
VFSIILLLVDRFRDLLPVDVIQKAFVRGFFPENAPTKSLGGLGTGTAGGELGDHPVIPGLVIEKPQGDVPSFSVGPTVVFRVGHLFFLILYRFSYILNIRTLS